MGVRMDNSRVDFTEMSSECGGFSPNIVLVYICICSLSLITFLCVVVYVQLLMHTHARIHARAHTHTHTHTSSHAYTAGSCPCDRRQQNISWTWGSFAARHCWCIGLTGPRAVCVRVCVCVCAVPSLNLQSKHGRCSHEATLWFYYNTSSLTYVF